MDESSFSFARLDPDAADPLQRLRSELGVSSFGLSLIALRPRQRLRVHRHERQEEVYLVMEGTLTLVVEGDRHALGPGQLARVGPAVRRQLTNPGSERVVVLAIGGEGEHRGRDGRAWSSWEEGGEGRAPQEVPLPDDLPAS
jgi:mannose-6-phosphate isomerase-like protein (cupin superfamily)